MSPTSAGGHGTGADPALQHAGSSASGDGSGQGSVGISDGGEGASDGEDADMDPDAMME